MDIKSPLPDFAKQKQTELSKLFIRSVELHRCSGETRRLYYTHNFQPMLPKCKAQLSTMGA